MSQHESTTDEDLESDVRKRLEDLVRYAKDVKEVSNKFASGDVAAQVLAAYLTYKSQTDMVKLNTTLATSQAKMVKLNFVLAIATTVLAVATVILALK